MACSPPLPCRHLIRSGCPDASTLPYGADVLACWRGRDWEAPRGVVWLEQPTLGAAPPRPVPPPSLPSWAEQPGSMLLALPSALLARVVGSLDEADSLQAWDSLACCCRQLRDCAAAHPHYWRGKCLRAAPFLDWQQLMGGPGGDSVDWRAQVGAHSHCSRGDRSVCINSLAHPRTVCPD